jgi:non-heme chloroperoxidase
MTRAVAMMWLATPLCAQNIAGTWQGTISAFGGHFRQVMHVAKADTGWIATIYSIDEAAEGDSSASVALRGSHLTITFRHASPAPDGGSFDGQLDPQASTIAGTWTQPDGRYPLIVRRVSPKDAWPIPAHTIRFIAVDTNVKLEVLDWGGSGHPVVFLSGLGGTAHNFDTYAPKFTPQYHVYGITRRGFGASSAPAPITQNYTATRLSDDVLAVLDSLHLVKPILVGHSIAGQEMSAIGSRHPDRVAGLVYLDAGYAYAYYDSTVGDFSLDRNDLEGKLHSLERPIALKDKRAIVRGLLQTDLPRIERDIRDWLQRMSLVSDSLSVRPDGPNGALGNAFLSGGEKFNHVPVPVLAFFAIPHDRGPRPAGVDSATFAQLIAADSASTAAQANAFAAGIPSARVVRLPHANHFVFQSNEAEVMREMNAFMAKVSGAP